MLQTIFYGLYFANFFGFFENRTLVAAVALSTKGYNGVQLVYLPALVYQGVIPFNRGCRATQVANSHFGQFSQLFPHF